MEEKKQKRIPLTHGSARVDEDCSEKTIAMLNKLSEIAYNMEQKKETKKVLSEQEERAKVNSMLQDFKEWSQTIPKWNGKECGNGCNCAAIQEAEEGEPSKTVRCRGFVRLP